MSRPEDRYIKLETKTLPNGKTVYKTAIPKSVVADPFTSATVDGGEQDRMDIIAHNVYGDASEWWRIAAANRRVNGSLHVKPGQTVIIPKV